MVKIIAEIGINHNGSVEICKKMMLLAKFAGVDYVKIQKRTPDLCVPEDQKMKLKDTPWGQMTYLEYKERIEFNESQIEELFKYAKEIDVNFFASVWDIPSVDLMCKYTDIGKIPSALITDLELCSYARKKFKLFMISTGMSTEEEIEECIKVCDPDIIMHTNNDIISYHIISYYIPYIGDRYRYTMY
jgi:N-acetylneuraminate synthase